MIFTINFSPIKSASFLETWTIGPKFLQTIPIPVQAQKILAWTGIIFYFVFQDHLKGNFLNSQQPMIVCEVSWLNFDNVFIIFEKIVEIQDQHHLSLNLDRDRL